MKLRALAASTALAGALALSAGSVQAADYSTATGWDSWDDWYFEFDLGGPLTDEYDFTRGGAPGTYDPDSGFGLAAALGRYFRQNMRAELAVSWFTAGDGVANFGGPVPHTGDVDVIAILGNVYYEFQDWAWMNGRVTPWIGAGLGVQIFDYDNLGGGDNLNGTEAAFTGALHAGFDYAVTENVDLVGRYTLAFVADHDATAASGTVVTIDSHVDHILMGGVRIKFNTGGAK